MIRVEIPGWEAIDVEHVVFDVNGTLTNHGVLIGGVAERVVSLRREVDVLLASADTFGTLSEVGLLLSVEAHAAPSVEEKLALIEQLGAGRTVHVGNGANDSAALRAAVIGFAVLGPEGISGAALAAADVVCSSVLDAIDLLLEPRMLAATLRS